MMLAQLMMFEYRIDPSNQRGAASATIGVIAWTATTAVPASASATKKDRPA